MAAEDFKRIDAEMFGKYADKKGIQIRNCPSCGISNPELLVHDGEATSVALAYAKGWDILQSALPLVAVECSNCGYLWLYNRDSVARKIEGD